MIYMVSSKFDGHLQKKKKNNKKKNKKKPTKKQKQNAFSNFSERG